MRNGRSGGQSQAGGPPQAGTLSQTGSPPQTGALPQLDPLGRALARVFVLHRDPAHSGPAGGSGADAAPVDGGASAATAAPQAQRHAFGLLASITGVVCNLVLCAAKALIGLMAGSLAMVADALNNLSDAAGNIVTLLGFKLAARPADEGHPYGHGRYEYLAGLTVAVLVIVIGVQLVREAVASIAEPVATQFNAAVVAVLLISIAVKLWMARFSYGLGSLIDSEALRASATDARNDCLATAAVLASALISHMSGLILDGWAGLVVGAFIVLSGLLLVRDTLNPLLGTAPDPKLVAHIRSKILAYPQVLGTHDLMVHDYGPGRLFASAHVEMAAEGDVLANHDILDQIEQDFKEQDQLVMTLHFDPIVTQDPAARELHTWISEHILEVDPRLSVHDVRTSPGPTHTNVIFDVVLPPDLAAAVGITGSASAASASRLKALKGQITQVVRRRVPQAVCKITFDSGFVSAEQ